MASDLSFNIVALDQASKTLDSVAARLEAVSVQLDRIDGKDATADVNVNTDQASSSIVNLNNQFAWMTAGIVAASPLAGAAVIGGLGAGFIGVAALAEKSNADVQASYQNLWSGVVAIAKAGADPLVSNFVASANAMSSTAQKLGPSLQQAFSYAGPDLVALTRGVDDFATNAMPGVVAAMASSLPVFQSVATAAGTLGTAASTSLTSLSQHSSEYGTVVTAMGQIAGSVLTGVVSLVNDLAGVWAQNAGAIVSDVQGIVTVLTGLGQGALPVVSGALHTAAEAVNGIVSVLGPLAPTLGTIGGVALTAFAAFKTASLVTAGVNALSEGAVTLAGNMQAGAVKAVAFSTSMLGVEAESSAVAGAVTAAGAATAAAGTEIGIGLSALAGPVGIIVGLVAGAVALGTAFSSTGSDTTQLSGNMDDLTAALQRSHGAFDQAAQSALSADPDFKKVADSVSQFGISSTDLTNALQGQGSSVDALKVKLQGIVDAHTKVTSSGADTRAGQERLNTVIDVQGQAAQSALSALGGLAGEYNKSTAAAADATAKQNQAAGALANSSQYQQAAAGVASALGLSLGDVTEGFTSVIAAAGLSASTVGGTSEAFTKTQLAVDQASAAMSQHFVQADQQVVQASQSVADAQHSVAQAAQSVTDAEHSYAQAQQAVVDAQQGVANAAHSVEQAQRSLGDALTGVTIAENNVTKAQESAAQAQVTLNQAREKAVQDLKDLNLQMQDQVLTEEQAKVKLFDAQNTAAGQGVTLQNAQAIAGQQVTTANESQMQAAFALISAQNALNDTLNSGSKLRAQVNDANQAGVDGAPGVISAQNALRNAQDQVASSAAALTKAHQAVSDAEYGVQQAEIGLQKAHQGVADAAWSLQKAHLGVVDAQYQQQKASQQLNQATVALRTAQDAASRSLDIHTAAGQNNLTMVNTLWDAITKQGLSAQHQYRTAIDDVAAAFGWSRDQAQSYLEKIGLIPKDFQYSVTAITQVDRNNFDSWLKGVLSTGGYAMDSRNQQKYVGGTGYATGGPITGPGGPTDDVIPIWASHGEYVQPADVVDYYGVDYMEAVRQRKLPRGGDGAAMPGYASGGLIEQAANSVYMGASLGAAYLATNNARMVMGFPTMPVLPQYVPPAAGGAGGPGGMIGYNAGAGVAQWAPQILQALSMLGQSAGWLGTVERRMQQESGGNPNIVNDWDCLTLDAMILTQRGWLKHDEVCVGDMTIGYNHKTGRSEWTRITRVVHYGDAPLVKMSNSRWSATTTPNHRWVNLPVKYKAKPELDEDSCPHCEWPKGVRRRGKSTRGGLRIHLATAHGIRSTGPQAEIVKEAQWVKTADIRAQDRLLLSAPATTESTLDISVHEAALLGWVAGDGHLERPCPTPEECAARGYTRTGVCQEHLARQNPTFSIAQTKPEMVKKLRKLLGDIPHVVYVEERLTRTGKEPAGPRHTFRVGYQFAQDLLRRAGHPRDNSVEQVLAMSSEQREAWLEAVIDAEGNRHQAAEGSKTRVSIYQRPGKLLDAIAIAVYLSGSRPRIGYAKRQGHPDWSPEAVVRVNNPVVTGHSLEREDAGRGDVWCVTTELGSWTARQEDHIFLTGNSNWQAGHPSVGLMQVIRGTFQGNAGPYVNTGPFSYGVSVDPLANIYAGLNYAVRTYGSLSALNRPGGYDSGGWLTPGGSGVNALSQPEAVLTPEQSQAFVQLAKSAAGGSGKGNTYVLNVYEAQNNSIDLKAQFQRMEIAAGIL